MKRHLTTRLDRLEATHQAVACPACGTGVRFVMLRNDEPEPSDTCSECGRPLELFVLRLVRVDPDDV